MTMTVDEAETDSIPNAQRGEITAKSNSKRALISNPPRTHHMPSSSIDLAGNDSKKKKPISKIAKEYHFLFNSVL
jgi:hypothetical protein